MRYTKSSLDKQCDLVITECLQLIYGHIFICRVTIAHSLFHTTSIAAVGMAVRKVKRLLRVLPQVGANWR